MDYFRTNSSYDYSNDESSDIKLYDSLKITLFLSLISQDSQRHKISVLISSILNEAFNDDTISDVNGELFLLLFIIESSSDYIFDKRDDKTLEILSVHYAGSILPLVYYFQDDMQDDEEFNIFFKNCTTNIHVFFDFARYMNKNYIFEINPRDKKRNLSN